MLGRGPLEIAFVELACRSVSNFSRARESSVKRSTDVDEDTLRGFFFGFGAATNGSGRCRRMSSNVKDHIYRI